MLSRSLAHEEQFKHQRFNQQAQKYHPPKQNVNVGDLVRFLGWEDPLEEGLATHCRILAGKIPWTEEPGGLQSKELQSQT